MSGRTGEGRVGGRRGRRRWALWHDPAPPFHHETAFFQLGAMTRSNWLGAHTEAAVVWRGGGAL